jgi:hypothetical protein
MNPLDEAGRAGAKLPQAAEGLANTVLFAVLIVYFRRVLASKT